jgi:hypothetical protein
VNTDILLLMYVAPGVDRATTMLSALAGTGLVARENAGSEKKAALSG